MASFIRFVSVAAFLVFFAINSLVILNSNDGLQLIILYFFLFLFSIDVSAAPDAAFGVELSSVYGDKDYSVELNPVSKIEEDPADTADWPHDETISGDQNREKTRNLRIDFTQEDPE